VTLGTPGGFRVTTTATPTATGAFVNPRAAGTCAADPDLLVTEGNEANNGCMDTVTVTSPDLTATKTNTMGGNLLLGGTWDWRIDVANAGNGAATFATGQVILQDDLPNANASYSAPLVSNQVGLSGAGTVSCSILASTLSCTASGGPVTLAASPAGFRVTTTVTPSQRGAFANPRVGGVCAVDPNLVVAEGNEVNNGCADTVNVNGPELTAGKSGSAGPVVQIGQPWDWHIDVANVGDAPASFPAGTVVVRDDLPVGAISYTGPTLSNQVGLGGAGTLSCVIASNTLTCTATGGPVTLGSPNGTFRVTVGATASGAGTFTNPRPVAFAHAQAPQAAGQCAVDPDGAVPEGDNENNNCLDTVTVEQDLPTAARLVGFHARASDRGVLLDWKTATEPGLLGFRVERARAGEATWLPVGPVVPAIGGASTGASYRLRDLPAPGHYRYRLTLVNLGPGWPEEQLESEQVVVRSRPAFLPLLRR
jgi:hypothetical protein